MEEFSEREMEFVRFNHISQDYITFDSHRFFLIHGVTFKLIGATSYTSPGGKYLNNIGFMSGRNDIICFMFIVQKGCKHPQLIYH